MAKAEAAKSEDIPEQLRWMTDAFGHDHPAVASAAAALASASPLPSSAVSPAHGPRSFDHWLMRLAFAWSLCVCAWLAAASLAWDRMDWLVWPVGVVLGMVVMRAGTNSTSGNGVTGSKWDTAGKSGKADHADGVRDTTNSLWFRGFIAALATLLAVLVVAFPATALTSDYRLRVPPNPPEWDHVWLSTRRGLTATNNIVYLVLGVMSAYRFASRKQPTVPGR